ncbi:N-acetyltransferase [Candidatus Uhrbacteria bacterium CG_4_9_14_3_um_filter_36_7]|uniref:N-acetyltransferase n=1 Tax=Candidatus Uhrbacteria bacterium CG_4_9_14_3_um_filter_36_7 TaxID=1975033 RepID=A0A2M7XGX0_9BACT|nr:MAG: N-acetyltransferase [Candidatus Uhrbacteria bacterium CG_4_9_14_3_um_filter_36_7]
MITVRLHRREDIPYRVKWMNNPKVNKFIGDRLGSKTTLKEQTVWFSNYQKDKTKKFFTICDQKKPIGFMGLKNISKENRNAELFILIGEDNYRGKGIGKIAMQWLLNYGFQKCKLHKINLGVIKDNIPAVKLYKSLGFKIEGVMKDEVCSNGRYYDFLSMAIFEK